MSTPMPSDRRIDPRDLTTRKDVENGTYTAERAEALRRASVDPIKLVAAGIAAELLLRGPSWEDWPEIGEHDWASVVAEVTQIARRLDPPTEVYVDAYAALAGRADPNYA